MTLVRYQPIEDRFAELPNRVLKGTMVPSKTLKGIETLLRVHSRIYYGMGQVYDAQGRKLADSADVQALYLLMHKVSELTADAALEAQWLS